MPLVSTGEVGDLVDLDIEQFDAGGGQQRGDEMEMHVVEGGLDDGGAAAVGLDRTERVPPVVVGFHFLAPGLLRGLLPGPGGVVEPDRDRVEEQAGHPFGVGHLEGGSASPVRW